MRIAILNPNSTDAMTQDMVAIARAALPSATEIVGLTNEAGPPAIQGEADAIACMPGLLSLAASPAAAGADAVVIGCFDDTGLADLRAGLGRPVVGLGEAGMIAATLAAPRFAVLTTTGGSVPVIAANIAAMGLGTRCDGVRASGIPVLDLQDRVPDLRAALAGLAAETGCGAIVLGCAGMGRLAGDLAGPGLPVLIEPVRASVWLAASVLRAAVLQGGTAPALPA
ncbi:Asp/Glu racemase [Rhodobacterales bacterium HKCCSP123]|nr:Asp/Glu racemase [Rhodobacterales bacterium HKCCSP123]